jgi:hypothetical protein
VHHDREQFSTSAAQARAELGITLVRACGSLAAEQLGRETINNFLRRATSLANAECAADACMLMSFEIWMLVLLFCNQLQRCAKPVRF